ncbi:Uma2 family endonuclease [Gammaproteobacteria bacterium]
MNTPRIKPKEYYTYKDYCTWPENERWELIDGTPYNMYPAPTRIHQEVVCELLRQIANYLKGKDCRVYTAPFDVRLPQPKTNNKTTDTVIQPDLAVICDKEKLDEKGCLGAPDWIIEVVSPNSASRDHITKRALYEKHGVREYWIVHPIDHLLTIYWYQQGQYRAPETLETTGQTYSNIFPELAIEWDDVFPSLNLENE